MKESLPLVLLLAILVVYDRTAPRESMPPPIPPPTPTPVSYPAIQFKATEPKPQPTPVPRRALNLV